MLLLAGCVCCVVCLCLCVCVCVCVWDGARRPRPGRSIAQDAEQGLDPRLKLSRTSPITAVIGAVVSFLVVARSWASVWFVGGLVSVAGVAGVSSRRGGSSVGNAVARSGPKLFRGSGCTSEAAAAAARSANRSWAWSTDSTAEPRRPALAFAALAS